MKFCEMPYTRPDIDETKKSFDSLTERLASAKSYADAKEVFLEEQKLEKHIDTLVNLVSIRHSVNTRDKFYDEEKNFWNGAMPELQEYMQKWTGAMLATPFREDFSAEYGDLMFVNAEISLKAFSPEIIPELQRENELVQEYEKLLASAQIPFEGGAYTLSQLSPFKTGADDKRRLAAWKAEGRWYKEHGGELDSIRRARASSRQDGQKARLRRIHQARLLPHDAQLLREGRRGEIPRRCSQVPRSRRG